MLRVRTVFTGPQGSPYLNTSYWLGDDTATEAQAAATAMVTFWTAVRGIQNAGIRFTVQPSVEVMDLHGEISTSFSVAGGTNVGAEGDQLAPFAAQGLLRLRTGAYSSGREIRGRWFIPGLTKNDVTDGRLDGAAQATINAAAATLVLVASPRLAVWSRKAVAIASVGSATMWDQWATLRSRRD